MFQNSGSDVQISGFKRESPLLPIRKCEGEGGLDEAEWTERSW